MTGITCTSVPAGKKTAALVYVLAFSAVLFIGILIMAYVVTKQSHPIVLDEHGKPVAAAPVQTVPQAGG